MPKKLLNAKIVESIKPPLKGTLELFDQKVQGLILRVYPTGRKTWSVRTKSGFAKNRVSIGSADYISLADAREQAHKILGASKVGLKNPQLSSAPMVFDELCRIYMDKHAKPNKKSWKEDQRKINKDLIPIYGGKVITEIRRTQVIDHLDTLVAAGYTTHVNRTLELIRKIFNFAIERDLLENTPCSRIKKPVKEVPRERVLNGDEIAKVWKAINRLREPSRSLMKFYFLTGQRAQEVKLAKRTDIDLNGGWWTIPVGDSKNKKTHRVPITPVIRCVLDDCAFRESQWLFPSPRLYRQNGELADAPMLTLQKTIQKIRTESGVDFNGHDFRRTMATWLASHRVPRITISQLLNHADRSVTSVYDRHTYDDEKRNALAQWTEFLSATESNK